MKICHIKDKDLKLPPVYILLTKLEDFVQKWLSYVTIKISYDKLSAIGHTSVPRLSQKSGHLLVYPRNLGKVAY